MHNGHGRKTTSSGPKKGTGAGGPGGRYSGGAKPGTGAGGPGGQFNVAARGIPPNVPKTKVSNNISAEVKSKMASASPFIRKPGGATRGKLSEVQRAALAGGAIYGAIAAGNQGGAVYNDGIMNLANRRRV